MDASLSDVQALTLVVVCAGLAVATIALDGRRAAALGLVAAVAFAAWTGGLAEAAIAALLLLLAVLAGSIVRQRRLRDLEHERVLVESVAAADARRHADVLEERARLARELHDVLAHSLSALSIQLERTRLLAGREAAPELVAQLERAHDLAGRGLAEARDAVGALRGDTALDDDAVRRLAADVAATAAVAVDVEITGTSGREPEHQLVVYRTVQEALTNAMRHAHPTRIRVAVDHAPTRTIVDIENDDAPATGSRPSGGTDRDGWGLQGLRERVALAGGSFDAGPRAAGGYRVHVELDR